jgi:hypothetical protein
MLRMRLKVMVLPNDFINRLQDFVYAGIPSLRLRPVRDDMLVENDETNCTRPVGMQCW